MLNIIHVNAKTTLSVYTVVIVTTVKTMFEVNG